MRAADAFAKEFPRVDQVSLREHCNVRRGVAIEAKLLNQFN
jgi:hypothetical protein